MKAAVACTLKIYRDERTRSEETRPSNEYLNLLPAWQQVNLLYTHVVLGVAVCIYSLWAGGKTGIGCGNLPCFLSSEQQIRRWELVEPGVYCQRKEHTLEQEGLNSVVIVLHTTE